MEVKVYGQNGQLLDSDISDGVFEVGDDTKEKLPDLVPEYVRYNTLFGTQVLEVKVCNRGKSDFEVNGTVLPCRYPEYNKMPIITAAIDGKETEKCMNKDIKMGHCPIFNVILPQGVEAGNYNVNIEVDKRGFISELNKKNNILNESVYVDHPDNETTCIDSSGMSNCLDNPTCYWDQETNKCYDGFSSKLIKETCSDPDGGKDLYKQAHTFGFRFNHANSRDQRIRTGGKDACTNNQVKEHYCDAAGFIRNYDASCPNGCSNGACINTGIQKAADDLAIVVNEKRPDKLKLQWTNNYGATHFAVKVYTGNMPDGQFIARFGNPSSSDNNFYPITDAYKESKFQMPSGGNHSYVVAIFLKNSAGKISSLSNIVHWNSAVSKPAGITDLRIVDGQLHWTAPASVSKYKIRFYTGDTQNPSVPFNGCIYDNDQNQTPNGYKYCVGEAVSITRVPGRLEKLRLTKAPVKSFIIEYIDSRGNTSKVSNIAVYRNQSICSSPSVWFEGQCTDPVPPCKNPPAYSVPSTCIDKIINGTRVERYSFACMDGYYKKDKKCIGEPNTDAPPADYEEDIVINTHITNNPFFETNIDSLEGQAAAYLYNKAVIGGYKNGNQKPKFDGGKKVNRGEIAKFILRARFGDITDIPNNGRFPDVKDGEWYVKYVVRAANEGIINGYQNGKFGPADNVTTAQFLKMLALAFDIPRFSGYSYSDVSPNAWYFGYTGIAREYNLFPNRSGNLLLPNQTLTRDEIAVAIYQYLRNK